MKTLLIMRHAKSSWHDTGLADERRPLNERGEQAARRMGSLLREQALCPDLVLSSSALRATESADLLVQAGGFTCPVQQKPELYLAPPSTYIEVLCRLPAAVRVALAIGHNPGLEELVARLSGMRERLPTGSIAQFVLRLATWAELAHLPQAELIRVWRPKELAPVSCDESCPSRTLAPAGRQR